MLIKFKCSSVQIIKDKLLKGFYHLKYWLWKALGNYKLGLKHRAVEM